MKLLPPGESNIRDLHNWTLRDHLSGKTTRQVSRLMKRPRLGGFIKKLGHTYCYYPPHFGKQIIAPALKFKLLVLIPQLAFRPA